MIEENKSIGVEELISEVKDEFDHIAEIYVWHALSEFQIEVHTGEAESLEQYIEMPYDRLEIDIGKSDPLSVEYYIIATCDGPGHPQGAEGTTIFMSKDVWGSEPRELAEGLTRLKQKLAGNCPICGKAVEDLNSHYREYRDCQEDDRL